MDIDHSELKLHLRARSQLRRWERQLQKRKSLAADNGSATDGSATVWVTGLVIATAVGLWISRGAWGPGPLAGEDIMGHLTRLDFALEHVIGDRRIDGWFPRFMLGHEMFLINGPGFTWVVGLVRVLSLGLLSLDGALKVVAIGSFVGLAPAVAFLARSLGISRMASVFAGTLSLTVSTTFGIGLKGLFVTGLVPQQVGAILLCLAVGSILRTIDRPGPGRILMAATWSSLLLLTHSRSALVAGIILILFAVARPRWILIKKSLATLGVITALIIGLASFWLVPFLAHIDLRGAFTAWDPSTFGDRVVDIWNGNLVYPTLISRLVFLAWIPALVLFLLAWRRGLVLLWIPTAIFTTGYAIQAFWGAGEVSVQLVDRALGYVGILALFPLAVLLGEIVPKRVLFQVAAAIFIGFVTLTASRTDAALADPFDRPVPQMASAAGELEEMVPSLNRFVVQRDFPAEIARTGVIHPETWLVYNSDRNALNVFGPELSPAWAWDAAERLGIEEPSKSATEFRRYGVTHVVSTSDEFAEVLAENDDYSLVWRDSPLAIFELPSKPGQPNPRTLLTATDNSVADIRPVSHDLNSMAFVLNSSSPSLITAPVSWSPKWTVEIDGRSVATSATDDMLLAFSIPAGPHDLLIKFESDTWDLVGIGITGVAMMTVMGFFLLRRILKPEGVSESRRSRWRDKR